MNQQLLTTLVPILKRRILQYHEMFSLPLIAEQWEETLSRALKEMGHPTTWKPNRSHKVGEDMNIKNIPQSRLSCKSGTLMKCSQLNKKDCVRFNGSRTSTQKTLEEKINHLSGDHDDYYFLLSKKKPTEDKAFDKKYKLLVFPSSVCKVNQLNWKLSKSGKAYKGEGSFIADIMGISMSTQLWTTLPLELIPYQFDIDCS